MRGPPGPETHQLPAGLQGEVVSKQRRQLRSADAHVAARQELVKGSRSQLGGYRFERFDGEHGDGGIHVRGFAEEPGADDALATRAERLRRVGRSAESRVAYEMAIELAGNSAEAATLKCRRDQLGS